MLSPIFARAFTQEQLCSDSHLVSSRNPCIRKNLVSKKDWKFGDRLLTSFGLCCSVSFLEAVMSLSFFISALASKQALMPPSFHA